MQIKKLILLLPTLMLFLLVYLNVKEYSVWQQILDGFNDDSIAQYLENIVSHTARLILMHPIIALSNVIGVNENTMFSYVVLLLFLIINFRVISWSKLYYGPISYFNVSLLINFTLLVFFLLMNGRNTFSFLGNALLFDAFLLIYDRKKIFLAFGLAVLAGFFCNVSSGTFAVLTINLFLHFIIVFVKRPLSKLSIYSLGLLICAVGVYTPVLVAGFYKNLEYYDYSVIKMLSHGYGDIIIGNLYFLLVLAPVGLVLVLWLAIFILGNSLSKFLHVRLIFFLTACFGGLFGYSSLVGALPVLLFLTTTLIWSRTNGLFVHSYD
jgi:hypothetical protein